MKLWLTSQRGFKQGTISPNAPVLTNTAGHYTVSSVNSLRSVDQQTLDVFWVAFINYILQFFKNKLSKNLKYCDTCFWLDIVKSLVKID